MGLLHEYFSAASDEVAASAIDHGPDRSAFDVIDMPDMEPITILAAVEQLLTGRDEDDIAEGPRFAAPVAERGGAWVVTITDELQHAIANSGDEPLAAHAAALATVDDLAGAETEMLAGLLTDLAGLARRATSTGKRLYCWTSL